ncbi:MAG: hypothetical protein ACOX0Z_00985 [Candidatus Nanosyncoccaceae bacterium]|jgi:hypothetical protein
MKKTKNTGGEELKQRERFIVALCAIVIVSLSAFVVFKYRGTLNSTKPVTEDSVTESENGNDDSPAKDKGESKKDTDTTTDKSDYSYTAKRGDSYTAMARKAIASYAEANGITLTAQQKLTAEVELAKQAGFPRLDIGQEVTISYNAVATIIKPWQTSGDIKKEGKSGTDYSYLATSGDSYTLLARQAITDYMKTNNLELNSAQRVAAETILSTQAGSPRLDVKEVVIIKLADVKSVVSAVQNFSASQQAAWQPYANRVVFK